MSIYTSAARFDSGRALSEDELRQSASSIFSNSPHETRSERLQPIPTIEVLRQLTEQGFVPVRVKQRALAIRAEPFTKHLIRLRRVDNAESYKVGDTVYEILLKNANDGTSAYDLMPDNNLTEWLLPDRARRSKIDHTRALGHTLSGLDRRKRCKAYRCLKGSHT
jgi:hypothetical protein